MSEADLALIILQLLIHDLTDSSALSSALPPKLNEIMQSEKFARNLSFYEKIGN